jgi:hypothetical protein
MLATCSALDPAEEVELSSTTKLAIISFVLSLLAIIVAMSALWVALGQVP